MAELKSNGGYRVLDRLTSLYMGGVLPLDWYITLAHANSPRFEYRKHLEKKAIREMKQGWGLMVQGLKRIFG